MTSNAEDQATPHEELREEQRETKRAPVERREVQIDKLKAIVEAALERNADKPVVLDVSDLTSYTESLVLLSGNSTRQVRAISSHIVKTLKARHDHPLGVEGDNDASWILIDANDVIVHVFDPETREKFDIEGLWNDAPRIELELQPRPALATEDDDEREDDQVPHSAN